VVGPIVALLDVRSEFVLREFVRELAFFAACDVPWAITKTDAACQLLGDPRVPRKRARRQGYELCRSGEKVEFTVSIVMGAGV
jgi:hypothetical protein